MRITEYYLLGPFASEIVNQHNITCEPLVVRFGDRMGIPTRLRVDLKPVNIPTCEGLDYRVIAYSVKDGQYIPKAILKLGAKCKPNENAILEQNINLDWDNCHIAFCLQEEKKPRCQFGKDKFYDVIILQYTEEQTNGQYIPKAILKLGAKCKPNENAILEQNINLDWDNCHIAFCLQEEKKPRCQFGKDKFYDVIILQYTEEQTTSDCAAPAGRCELTLDVGNYCKISNPTKSTQDNNIPKLSIHPIGSGDYESRVEINCSALGQKFDLLSLHQNRTKGNKHVLLKIVQYLKEEEGRIKMTLHKTVSVYDKGSTIYCVKHKPDYPSYERKCTGTILRDGDYNYTENRLVPNIIVEPDTETAEFRLDKPLNFACKGTALTDHQSLTWYIRDPKTSELQVPDASSQQYNQTTNESRLSLWLNDSYDSKTLFCAQDDHLVVVHASGRRSVVRYGEAATSRNITLKVQETDVALTGLGSSGPDIGLVCGVVAGIAALLVVTALVAWRLRRRGAGEGGVPEENQYATIAEVTYAELALKECAEPPKNQNSSPYAQIVGVYNPRK